ncbi:MAG: hypothetical protein ACXWJK_00315 [Burkholderiaceae bacterium]
MAITIAIVISIRAMVVAIVTIMLTIPIRAMHGFIAIWRIISDTTG